MLTVIPSYSFGESLIATQVGDGRWREQVVEILEFCGFNSIRWMLLSVISVDSRSEEVRGSSEVKLLTYLSFITG